MLGFVAPYTRGLAVITQHIQRSKHMFLASLRFAALGYLSLSGLLSLARRQWNNAEKQCIMKSHRMHPTRSSTEQKHNNVKETVYIFYGKCYIFSPPFVNMCKKYQKNITIRGVNCVNCLVKRYNTNLHEYNLYTIIAEYNFKIWYHTQERFILSLCKLMTFTLKMKYIGITTYMTNYVYYTKSCHV